MQFIFVTLNNCDAQTVNKTKLAKWRHLDSLFCMILIIGLTFFVIMQNGKMREQIKQQLNNEVIEQIVNDKILIILQELNKMKTIILDQSNRIHAKEIELQVLIKSLSKQLGLPLEQEKPNNLDIQQQQHPKPAFYRNTYEVFEIYQGIESQQTYLFPQTDIPSGKVEKKEGKTVDGNKQTSYAICSYLQYWFQSQNQPISKVPAKIPKYNNLFYVQKMNFANITAEEIGNIEQFFKDLKVFVIWMGNAFLVLTLCISMLMMISFILNRKNKTKYSLLKQLLKKMSQLSKKRPSKSQKQLLYF